jgi:periplasmic divalent cation tolerance protein
MDLSHSGRAAGVPMSEQTVLVYSSFPEIETARRIAHQLVSENLAACANIIPVVESIYQWQNKIEQANEVLVLFKTTTAIYPEFQSRLEDSHPYDVPEIICVDIANGLPSYLRWVADNTARINIG